ncbi:ABC transporter permease [Paenibacillus sp. J2TS4]|uniref:ABC transporter permease n=1 Tax=Paenibacillus sp. J2TS4 TaxID=2807194 RepID=UPI001B2DD79E|nr:ABC transporter permease [Paenibacillus sp. J2TS4]GIP34923.1 transport permease protein [Paenibacillus sp. J2TS4]
MNFIKIVKLDLINILKNPTLLISNTVLPLILIGVLGFATSGLFGAGDVSSYDYYGVTMMIFTALMIAMTVSNTFMEDKVKRGNARIVFAPVSKMEIYLSKVAATFIMGTLSYSALLLIGQYLFHMNFGGQNIGYIMLLISAFSLFGCCLGTMFCCIFKSEEGANAVLQVVVMLLVFFGGIFFPVANLGKFVETVSYLSPVKWMTESAFRIIYDHDFSLFLPVLALVLSGSFVCLLICQILYKPEEYA